MFYKALLFTSLLFFLAINSFAQTEGETLKQKNLMGESRFINITELYASIGDATGGLGMHSITGYMFHSKLSLGLGLGFDFMNDTEALIPVFIDSRYYFRPARFSPFIAQSFGLTYGANAQNRTGTMISSGLGVKFPISKKNSMNMILGYKYYAALDDPSYLNFRIGFNF